MVVEIREISKVWNSSFPISKSIWSCIKFWNTAFWYTDRVRDEIKCVFWKHLIFILPKLNSTKAFFEIWFLEFMVLLVKEIKFLKRFFAKSETNVIKAKYQKLGVFTIYSIKINKNRFFLFGHTRFKEIREQSTFCLKASNLKIQQVICLVKQS